MCGSRRRGYRSGGQSEVRAGATSQAAACRTGRKDGTQLNSANPLLSMTSYLSGVIDYVGAYPQYAIIAVFLLAWSEAIPIVGTVVPGSTLIIGISALATGADIAAAYLVLAATLGAIAGDGSSFWVGMRYHRELLLRWPMTRYPRLIAHSEAFIRKYGIASVFLARFTAVVRAFVPLVAGILRMSRGRFYVANVLSALVWAPLHVFPGVIAAVVLHTIGADREHLAAVIVGGVILVSAACGFMHGWKSENHVGEFVSRWSPVVSRVPTLLIIGTVQSWTGRWLGSYLRRKEPPIG
jgi:membrane protein DedA with SNARE-associated domain